MSDASTNSNSGRKRGFLILGVVIVARRSGLWRLLVPRRPLL